METVDGSRIAVLFEDTSLPGATRTAGWYWFVGRSKQLIIRGGSNIAPGEVEAARHEHPAVREAVVVGVPDPPLGERVAAWVAPLEGCDVGAGELERFVGERIAAHKVPEWIWIDRALPTTSIGKLDRVTLERRAAERVAEPRALPSVSP